MISICIPSRGLIYSKVIEGVFEGIEELNARGIKSRVFISNNLPIPDAHNDCVKRALETDCDRILFVEEDNYVDRAAFVALATSASPIATLQYNDKNGSPHGIIHYNEALEILWCGLGATSIQREVFEVLGEPYFRTDTRYKITKKHLTEEKKLVTEYERIEPRDVWNPETNRFDKVSDPYQYGGLDVDFFTRARQNGFKIQKINDMKSIHLKVNQYGEPYTNQGIHDIVAV